MDDYSSLFETHDIDIIIHTATQYSRNNINANEIISANVLFPAKILDCAIQYNVKCFINTVFMIMFFLLSKSLKITTMGFQITTLL